MHKRQDKLKIQLRARRDGQWIRVDILDEGIGINIRRKLRRNTSKARNKIDQDAALTGGMSVGKKVIQAGLSRVITGKTPFSQKNRSGKTGTQTTLYLPTENIEHWELLKSERSKVMSALKPPF